MKNNAKKVISLLMALVMVCSLVVLPVSAVEATAANLTLDFEAERNADGEIWSADKTCTVKVLLRSEAPYLVDGGQFAVKYDASLMKATKITVNRGTIWAKSGTSAGEAENNPGEIDFAGVADVDYDADEYSKEVTDRALLLLTIVFTAISDEADKATLSFGENKGTLGFSGAIDSQNKVTHTVKGTNTLEVAVPGDPPALATTFTFTDTVKVNGTKDTENPTIQIPEFKAGKAQKVVDPDDLNWTVTKKSGDGDPAKVTVGAGGVVTVDRKIKDGVFTITGTPKNQNQYSGTISGDLTVTRETPEVTTIQLYKNSIAEANLLSGTDSIVVPKSGGPNSTKYVAQVLDQFGEVMRDANPTVTITKSGSDEKITFDDSTDTITVAQGASVTKDVCTVTASCSPAQDVVVNVSTVDITFEGVTYDVNENATYGDKWSTIITHIDGTAKVGDTTVAGTFALSEPDGVPEAKNGAVQVQLVFTSADKTTYVNVPVPAEKLPEPGTVTIKPKSVTGLTVTGVADVDYTGSAHTPVPVVKDGDTTLTADTDYTVTYADNTNAGTAKVTITGMGNYDSATTKVVPFTIRQVQITEVTGLPTVLNVSKEQVRNAATLQTLGIPAAVGLVIGSNTGLNKNDAVPTFDKTLADVKAVAETVTEAADKEVVLTLTGTFPGWAKAPTTPYKTTIKITSKYPIPESAITFNDVTAIYSDEYTTPATVTPDGNKYDNVKYTVTFTSKDGTDLGETKPTDAGEYTMTVTVENDNYKGSKPAKLTITPKALAAADVTIADVADVEFNGTAHKPTPAVTLGGTALVADKDYELTYANNINAGEATITVTFKGNYSGSAEKKFNITPLALVPVDGETGNATVTGVSESYDYTGNPITPKVNVTVKGITGALVENTDYTLTYTNNQDASNDTTKAKITITGKGNYSGTLEKTFEIKKVPLTGTVGITVSAAGAEIAANDTLTLDLSKLSEKTAANLDIQWMKNGNAISGEKGETYTVEAGDTGANITVKVTAKDTSNYTGEATSTAIKVGAKPMPSGVTVMVAVTVKDGAVELVVTVTGITADELKANFKVQWFRNGAAEGAPVAINDENKFVCPTTPKPGETWTAELVPASGSEYTGSVKATKTDLSAAGGSGATGTGGNVGIPATAPSAPTVRASAGNGKVTISWEAEANGSNITNWVVSCEDAEGNVIKSETVSGDTTSYVFDGLTNNTQYTFKVVAKSNEGDSAAGSVTAKPAAPATPSNPSRPSGGVHNWWWDDTTTKVNTVKVPASSKEHGNVTVSSATPKTGNTVTITVKPDEGYVVDTVRVIDANGGRVSVKDIGSNKYTFTMPNSSVEVEVTFAPEKVETPEGFTDVPDSYWAKDAIQWVNDNGYMKGNSETTFNPDGRVTRQQLWMILARMAGADPYDFTDAKNWAISNGISDGSNPGNSVTRQQMVTILYRYAQMKGYTTTGGTDIGSFPDSSAVAAYAQEAISWSVGNSIVGGTANGYLNPNGTATRAQFATILQRFYNTVV